MVFPPQHLAEDAVSGGVIPGVTAAGERSAHESRVVFQVAPPIPYDLTTLLGFAEWTLAVQGMKGTPPDDVTALELPESLILTPTAADRFTAAAEPITHGGISELWTARLGDGAGLLALENLPNTGPPLALRSPSAADRDDLVDATDPPGAPAVANRLWLSSHGAFADIAGEWDTGNIERWLHRIVTGRDIAVEVSRRGFLLPFGHPASWLTVTERLFVPDIGDEVVAVLVQQTYLVVTGAELGFPRPLAPFNGRRFPFSQVTVDAKGWIPAAKDPTPIPGIAISDAWNVHEAATSADLVLAYTAADRVGGEPVSLALPAAFLEQGPAYA